MMEATGVKKAGTKCTRKGIIALCAERTCMRKKALVLGATLAITTAALFEVLCQEDSLRPPIGGFGTYVTLFPGPQSGNTADLGVNTPLFAAARDNDLRGVTALLAAGNDPNVMTPDSFSVLGGTPLHVAIRRVAADDASVKIVKALIEAGAKVNARDRLGRTPLHYISFITNVDIRNRILALLMKAGADWNVVDVEGDTPIHLTIDTLLVDPGWYPHIFKEYGEKINPVVNPIDKKTAVNYARDRSFMDVVKVLCEQKKWRKYCSDDDCKGYLSDTWKSVPVRSANE